MIYYIVVINEGVCVCRYSDGISLNIHRYVKTFRRRTFNFCDGCCTVKESKTTREKREDETRSSVLKIRKRRFGKYAENMGEL